MRLHGLINVCFFDLLCTVEVCKCVTSHLNATVFLTNYIVREISFYFKENQQQPQFLLRSFPSKLECQSTSVERKTILD